MDFTDKTQQCLAEAIQLAKDYANAQGTLFLLVAFILLLILSCLVHPAHLAFVLLNEGASGSTMPGGPQPQAGGTPLFASVVSRAGGDPVPTIFPFTSSKC